MIIADGVSDIKKRTDRDEFYYLNEKYPHVAFNYRWGSNEHTRKKGFKHIVVAEPYIEVTENWDWNYIKQYKTYITFNRKQAEQWKNKIDVRVMRGCMACNQYFHLENFKNYDEKINGVIFLAKLNRTGREGDIYYQREKVLNELQIDPMVKHVWSREPWGGSCYQGSIPFFHSHYENLKKLNEYKFCVCFESTYHEFWSWDFVTERMFNCFKSKTIPIYLGCYNIEEYVPKHLFIDYRDFNFDNKALSEYLLNFPKDKYISMTEEAFEWNKTNRIGNIQDLENILRNLK